MKFSEIVKTKEEFERAVLAPNEFIREKGLTGEEEHQVWNVASIVGDALKINPVSLSDLSANYAHNFADIDSKLSGAGVAAAGFTDHFTKNYTNSAGSVVAEMIGFDPGTMELNSLSAMSKFAK